MNRDTRRSFTARQVRQLLIAANYKCQCCGAELLADSFEAHHVRRHADGGRTELYNGMIVCIPCHKEITKMSFNPREWQKQCLERFLKKINENGPGTSFVLEACMGSGKSTMAAWIAKILLENYSIHHVLVIVPWRSIQGDIDKGMLGSFGEMGLDPRPRFFTDTGRRQVRQPRPQLQATVTLYQEVCCQAALDTIRMWKTDQQGFDFALICDEIHHTNEINSAWGSYIQQLKSLATYSVFMSGTYFRSDKKPISCIPLDERDWPIKDFYFRYTEGVRQEVVRPVTCRHTTAKVKLRSHNTQTQKTSEYEIDLEKVGPDELGAAKRQVLDPKGECIGEMIKLVHEALLKTRQKFPDAACLFVCRPGGRGNYTQDSSQERTIEDKHVRLIAERIKEITGHTAVVVTYSDTNSAANIARFRRGTEPYLVAVNMVSEGCDIPRIRAIAFCRYTNSEMLFRQIAGRALRIHSLNGIRQEDPGAAAQIYIPAFPVLVQYATHLYDEAQEGIQNKRCPVCGQWPCICPCAICGEFPCICPCPECGQKPCVCPPRPPKPIVIEGISAIPILDGGSIGNNRISESNVSDARQITTTHVAFVHFNEVLLGGILKQYDSMKKAQPEEPAATPPQEREQLRQKINRIIKKKAIDRYDRDYPRAYYHEIQVPFRSPLTVILNTWPIERLRDVLTYLERQGEK